MGYHDIRYVHGTLEDGKDIVFSRYDPLDQDIRCCATVKRRQLNGSVSSSRSIRELYFQIDQALTEPYLDPFSGREFILGKVYVVTPFPCSNSCIRSIRAKLRSPENRLAFIDGPKLHSLVRKHLPDLLITLPNPELRYLDALIRSLSEAGSQFAEATRRSLLDIYISGRVTRTTREDARHISFAATPIETIKTEGEEDTSSPIEPFAVLLADVGAGKTTFLQKLAIDVASGNSRLTSAGERLLPLLVPLHLLPSSSYLDEENLLMRLANISRNATGTTSTQISQRVPAFFSWTVLMKFQEPTARLPPLSNVYPCVNSKVSW
jgi:hypothetical protein